MTRNGQAFYRDWTSGKLQSEIAHEHGITPQAVSATIRRYLADVPDQDRHAAWYRNHDRLERLYQVVGAKAEAGNVEAAAVAKNIIAESNRMLGLHAARRIEMNVEQTVTGTVEHRVETIDQVAARILERQRLQAEITRSEP